MSNKQTEKKRTGLGGNPLSLFTPTTHELEEEVTEAKSDTNTNTPTEKTSEPGKRVKSSKKTSKAKGAKFLEGVEDSDKESIGLQVTTDVNDWLDTVVKDSRRKHGKKLKKQIIIQAGVELLRAMPVEWSDIESIDELRNKLQELSEKIN